MAKGQEIRDQRAKMVKCYKEKKLKGRQEGKPFESNPREQCIFGTQRAFKGSNMVASKGQQEIEGRCEEVRRGQLRSPGRGDCALRPSLGYVPGLETFV